MEFYNLALLNSELTSIAFEKINDIESYYQNLMRLNEVKEEVGLSKENKWPSPEDVEEVYKILIVANFRASNKIANIFEKKFQNAYYQIIEKYNKQNKTHTKNELTAIEEFLLLPKSEQGSIITQVKKDLLRIKPMEEYGQSSKNHVFEI